MLPIMVVLPVKDTPDIIWQIPPPRTSHIDVLRTLACSTLSVRGKPETLPNLRCQCTSAIRQHPRNIHFLVPTRYTHFKPFHPTSNHLQLLKLCYSRRCGAEAAPWAKVNLSFLDVDGEVGVGKNGESDNARGVPQWAVGVADMTGTLRSSAPRDACIKLVRPPFRSSRAVWSCCWWTSLDCFLPLPYDSLA